MTQTTNNSPQRACVGVLALTGEHLRAVPLDAAGPYSVGGAPDDAVMLPGFPARCAVVERQAPTGWQVRATAGTLSVGGREHSVFPLELGVGISFVVDDRRTILRAYQHKADDVAVFPLLGRDEWHIGRARDNDIVLQDRHISGHHAKLTHVGEQWRIADRDSSNGVYVNGVRAKDAPLAAGDVVHLMHYAIAFTEDAIHISNAGEKLHVPHEAEPQADPCPRAQTCFRRSPRIVVPVPEGQIEIQRPPAKQERPEINWLPVLIQPMILVATSLLLGYVIARSSGNYLFMFMSIPFALASVLVAALNYRAQIKRFQARETLRQETYRDYLKSKHKELASRARTQRACIERIHPEPQTCIHIAQSLERRLWERSPEDDDFLSLRVGRSDQPLTAILELDAQRGVELDKDPLNDWPDQLAAKFRTLASLPFTVNFKQHAAIGITGNRANAIAAIRCMMLQLAVHHSFEDVHVVCVFDERDSATWDWLRFLPHVWDDNRQTRALAATMSASGRLLDNLLETLKMRQRLAAASGNTTAHPHIVLILANPFLAQGHEVMSLLQTAHGDLGVSVVYLSKSLREVPGFCSLLLRCDADSGLCVDRLAGGKQTAFQYDAVSLSDLDALARRLFAVKLDSFGGQMELPESIRFLRGYGVQSPAQIPIARNWRENAAYRSLAAPIGVLAGGKVFALDAHEKAHGPHGLIAGTTGSGKSELILSWLLSMAVNYHPHEVAFLLIDYKGGGMADMLRELPHTLGSITNIDDASISRSLVSLQSELQRRLVLLRSAGVSHIDRYLERRVAGAKLEALPHLFLIVDEFGELKRDQPDFMQALISAARVGRSVGIHLVLATQKPSGLVDDQIWSNARFKICLRVQDISDSREMLHRNDAALITTSGRAYLQVGHDEIFELMQTFWSTAIYAEGQDQSAASAALVALDGQRKRIRWSESREANTEITALVREIARVAAELAIEPLPGLWLPELPAQISLDEIAEPKYRKGTWQGNAGPLCFVAGLYDDPVAQKQAALAVDLEETGHIGIYGAPGSGKTTLLKTALLSIFTSFAPDEAQAYLFDLGGYGLAAFSQFPHVGSVMTGADEEKASRVLNWLLGELERRKRLLADLGVGTIEAYRNATGHKLPSIVVAIDNFPALFELFDSLDSAFVVLSREGASSGIHLVFTSNGTTGIRYKVLQNISGALALSMSDAGEYNAIVGNIGKRPFMLPPGRGFTKGREPLDFLAALPVFGHDEATRTAAIRALSFEMARHWQGDLPYVVRSLPDVVRYEAIESAAREDFLPLGLDADDIQPAGLAFDRFHCAALSCAALEPGAKLVSVAMRGVPSNADIRIFDAQQLLRPLASRAQSYVNFERDPDAVASVMHDLVQTLDARKEVSSTEDAHPPIYILVANLPRFIETVAEPERDILERIARMGEGLRVYVLALGLAVEWMRWKEIETLARALTAGGVGAAIGGMAGDHGIFSDVFRPLRDKNLADGFVLAVEPGRVQRLRMAGEGV